MPSFGDLSCRFCGLAAGLDGLVDDIGNGIKQKILAASDEDGILPAYLDSAVRRSAENAAIRDLCEVHVAIECGLHLIGPLRR